MVMETGWLILDMVQDGYLGTSFSACNGAIREIIVNHVMAIFGDHSVSESNGPVVP